MRIFPAVSRRSLKLKNLELDIPENVGFRVLKLRVQGLGFDKDLGFRV